MQKIYKALVLAAILALPCAAFARAGGGHGGVSSPSSSSSSSHSSSSFGSSAGFATGVATGALADDASGAAGIVIVLLIIGAIVVFVVIRSKSGNLQNIADEIQNLAMKDGIDLSEIPEGSELSMEVLTAKDPNFTEQKFKELVNIAFYKIQNAWSAGDMSSARAFISDGIMKRFSLQLE